MGSAFEWEKVFAYILRGSDLLVFEQPDRHGAGLQVPGGTLEVGEDPSAGVLREAMEETGLARLSLVRALGTISGTWAGRTARMYGFEVRSEDELLDTWEHGEYSYEEPIRFVFRWVRLPYAASALFPEQAHFAQVLAER